MGDIGTAVPQGHLDALKGKVDLLLALTGDHATIALPDLDRALSNRSARRHPHALFQCAWSAEDRARGELPGTCPGGNVTRVSGSSVEIDVAELPPARCDAQGLRPRAVALKVTP